MHFLVIFCLVSNNLCSASQGRWQQGLQQNQQVLSDCTQVIV
jgi:hypothetical protein